MLLQKISDSAKADFPNIPFPHKKDEYWRFADLQAWGIDGLFPYFSSTNPPQGEQCVQVRELEKSAMLSKLVLVDGQVIGCDVPEGAEIISLRDACRDYAWLVEKFYAQPNGKLDAFQASRAESSVFIRIRENASVALDVSVIAKLHLSPVGVFFLLEKNSKLSLTKISLTFGGSLSCARFGFWLADGSRLEYAQHKYSERASLMFEREDFFVSSGCEIVDAMAQEGLAHSRSERNFFINGERSDIDSRVFLKTSGDVTADLRTKQIHSVESSKSNLEVKAAISDTSSIAFTGLIDVCEKAQKTEAYQGCRSLLLSKDAKAQASPILEISANDVMCSHGCTVAEPDREELFYMQQRGLNLAQAKQMIVDSFAGSTFSRIQLD